MAILQNAAAAQAIVFIRLLGADAELGVGLRNAVPLHDALHPLLRGRQHRHCFPTMGGQAALKQVDGVQPHDEVPLRLPTDTGQKMEIHDVIEPSQRVRVGKNHLPQLLPIQLFIAEYVSEGAGNVPPQSGIGRQLPMVHGVAVDDMAAQPFKGAEGAGLAAAGAAGEADDQIRQRVGVYHMETRCFFQAVAHRKAETRVIGALGIDMGDIRAVEPPQRVKHTVRLLGGVLRRAEGLQGVRLKLFPQLLKADDALLRLHHSLNIRGAALRLSGDHRHRRVGGIVAVLHARRSGGRIGRGVSRHRFVNGDPSNDVVKGLKEQTASQEPNARHGGDLAGMTKALDYLNDLGVTTVWPTPLQVNDMPSTSYHGYAITDYYEIDPRFGGNEAYVRFIDEAHKRGMKVIQDMVFNHCGSENFLFRDRPDDDWFNCGSRYVQTSYRISAVTDIHGSEADKTNARDGWFVEVMPDLNQRNPHVWKYLTQNSIWWTEHAGIDGIRQDTYPYADRQAMARWNQALLAEYPHFNIVGETWLNHNVGVSQWQKGSKLAGQDNDSELPTVMDFPLMGLLNSALDEETNDWDKGLARIYEYISQDAVYADPTHLLTFLSNHDTDRFARVPIQASVTTRYRQALTLLLTLRGIPQLYVGDELAMAANKGGGDGLLRANFPGGFSGDTINALSGEGLTPLMRETHDFTRHLLQWRRGNEAISRGTLRHYAINHGIYVYSRQAEGRTVTVIMNGTNQEVELPLGRYAEVLPESVAREVITDRTVSLGDTLRLAPRDIFTLDFQ